MRRRGKGFSLQDAVSRCLEKLSSSVDAREVHLFRVRLDESQSTIGIRYSSSGSIESVPSTLRKFPFQLLSPQVQECLLQNKMVHVSLNGDQCGGGRPIGRLLRSVEAGSYLLCPLFLNGKLKGVLGVAGQESQILIDSESCEQLQINGTLLLHELSNRRRDSKRRKRHQRWRRIADQACDFAVGIDKRFEIAQSTGFRLRGQLPNLVGLRLVDLVARPWHDEAVSQIRRACEEMEVRTFEFQIQLLSEGPRWFLARIEPAPPGSHLQATLYLTDTHRDKVFEEAIRELTDRLQKSSRMSLLGQMSTEFAHQLNQPLQAILNYCNTMQKRLERGTDSKEKQRNALQAIEQSVIHSAEIIQSIREFVQFRSLKTEVVSLDLLLEHATMMVLPRARSLHAELITPSSKSGIEVEADRTQTIHVLVNLIVNALEACDEAGISAPRIIVDTRPDPNQTHMQVLVTDNGPGVPAEKLESVFEKFQTGKPEGLGIGLTISRDVCESQGGKLWVENNPNGIGCTFCFTLPIVGDYNSDTTELPVIDQAIQEPV
jgi:signal transduction histidine kinase